MPILLYVDIRPLAVLKELLDIEAMLIRALGRLPSSGQGVIFHDR